MYSRFSSIASRVADWHIAKEAPTDLFGLAFFNLREKVRAMKDKLSIGARDSLRSELVKDLKDKGFEVVSAEFSLGQYRGSKFMTSAKVSVRVGTEAKAKKLGEYLLKYSPKYKLKEFSEGIAFYNIR